MLPLTYHSGFHGEGFKFDHRDCGLQAGTLLLSEIIRPDSDETTESRQNFWLVTPTIIMLFTRFKFKFSESESESDARRRTPSQSDSDRDRGRATGPSKVRNPLRSED